MYPVSRSARELADRVRVELRYVKDLDPSGIVVGEHHGHITLRGHVGSLPERDVAVRVARRVPGVRSIDVQTLRIDAESLGAREETP